MGAVSPLLSLRDQKPLHAVPVLVFVVALSLLVLSVVALVMSGAFQPEAHHLVAPFRWFYADSATA